MCDAIMTLVWSFFIFCFSRRSCSALLCYPQAAPLPFARSGFSGSLREDALWPMRHEIAVGERLDKYWFRNCHGCWLCDWPVYPANGREMERSCPFLSDSGTCTFQHCPRYLWGKGLKAQSSVISQKGTNPLKDTRFCNPFFYQWPSILASNNFSKNSYAILPEGRKVSKTSKTDTWLLWGVCVQPSQTEVNMQYSKLNDLDCCC